MNDSIVLYSTTSARLRALRSWRNTFFALLLVIFSVPNALAEVPLVAAAADLKFALKDIAHHYRQETRREIKFVFGSSGNLYHQIAQGAPFRIFLSADEDFVLRLHEKGKTQDRGKLYAIGRLVIIAPLHSAMKVDGELKDLTSAMSDGRLKKFAIANPEHAPYGRRAMEALKHAGLWEQIEKKLVLGENVAQATQFAMSGSTQGGIVAYSMALSPAIGKRGNFALIPATWHKPLRQRMVLIKGADAEAIDFYAYLQQHEAQKILKQYGFSVSDGN